MSIEAKAGALALLVHAAFLLLLVFGVSWQTEQPEPVMVDLWQTLPEPPAPTPPTVQKPKPAPPIKAPPPKPVVKELPSPKAPDIGLEKKKRDAEQIAKNKQAELDEKLLLKKEREAVEKLKQREAQKLNEEQALQRRMMEEDLARESRQLKQLAARGAAQRRSSEVSGIVAQFQNEIKAKIRSNTRLPENLKGNPQVKFEVRLLPTGEVVGVKQTKSSGVPEWDDAVERAITKSSPLPLPTEKDARAEFVPSFVLSHRPHD